MLNPYELAQQARERAVANYKERAAECLIEGDTLLIPTRPYDMDGAVAKWLDGLKALDCAEVAAIGLENK